MSRPEYLVIITGLSGSGKSYVQSTLEDLGFYCCDNLPIHLIEPFLEDVGQHQNANRVGIVVDVRTHDFANIFPQFYRERIKKLVPNAVLIFLEATDEVLARRYSETRRPHPLAKDLPIMEAIQAERAALTEVKSLANMVLDTSQHSHPYSLDLLFDVRFLPNPHFVEALRPKIGTDPEVIAYLRSHPEYDRFYGKLLDFVTYLLPEYQKEMKSYLTIGLGCTGGRHRSVAIAEELARRLRDHGLDPVVLHRDVDR
jgi:UPF0042 nucleotide-binding protein